MDSLDLRLTNDDEPASLAPRRITIIRGGLRVGENPAVLVSVDPPLDGAPSYTSASHLVLVSRTLARSVDEIIHQADTQPGRVYVCRYVGQAKDVPAQLTRDDLEILFWGLVDTWQSPQPR